MIMLYVIMEDKHETLIVKNVNQVVFVQWLIDFHQVK